MKKNINVGIIGTGFGKMIGMNFKAIDPSMNLFFSGRNKEKLEFTAKEVGAEGIYADWKEMIDDPKIDLVVIASPSGMHKEMFIAAAKNNKNILVEKPAALFSSDIKEMEATIRGENILAVVNHEGRFHPVISYIKEKIESGELGNVMTVRIGVYTNWYSNPDYKENWNQDSKLGGGQIFSIGSHTIDLARYILDFPEIINGSVQKEVYQDPRFTKKATAESQFAAHFETNEGTSIQLFNDCYSHGYKDFTLDVVGSKGIIMYSDTRGLKESYSNPQTLTDVSWTDPISNVTLGNSILSKSMKYIAKALVEYLKKGERNKIFCTLEQEAKNLELFEKYLI